MMFAVVVVAQAVLALLGVWAELVALFGAKAGRAAAAEDHAALAALFGRLGLRGLVVVFDERGRCSVGACPPPSWAPGAPGVPPARCVDLEGADRRERTTARPTACGVYCPEGARAGPCLVCGYEEAEHQIRNDPAA